MELFEAVTYVLAPLFAGIIALVFAAVTFEDKRGFISAAVNALLAGVSTLVIVVGGFVLGALTISFLITVQLPLRNTVIAFIFVGVLAFICDIGEEMDKE